MKSTRAPSKKITKPKYPVPTYDLYEDLKLGKYVLVPFDNKDDIKNKYKSLRWDTERKLWYTDNKKHFDEMADYQIKYYDTQYEHRSDIKEAGFKWDPVNKSWYGCNALYNQLPVEVMDETEALADVKTRQLLNECIGDRVPEPSNV